jgi:hypothetical protein
MTGLAIVCLDESRCKHHSLTPLRYDLRLSRATPLTRRNEVVENWRESAEGPSRERDLHGMTGERCPSRRLNWRQNMLVCSSFASRSRLSHLRDQRGRPVGDRRSSAPRLTTEGLDLQDVFHGSDGTRTRDLRRDRPVLVFPHWAGTGGDSRREQGFRAPSCGNPRASAEACGSLLRDERGMTRCLSSEQAVSLRDADRCLRHAAAIRARFWDKDAGACQSGVVTA